MSASLEPWARLLLATGAPPAPSRSSPGSGGALPSASVVVLGGMGGSASCVRVAQGALVRFFARTTRNWPEQARVLPHHRLVAFGKQVKGERPRQHLADASCRPGG